jgi:hypothetical protein
MTSIMDAWKEPATLLRRSEPKRDPLGVAYRTHDVQEIELNPVLVATNESANREDTGEDYGIREEITVYWDDRDDVPGAILPGDRVRLRGGTWEPVGALVGYPLGVYLRLRKEEPRER